MLTLLLSTVADYIMAARTHRNVELSRVLAVVEIAIIASDDMKQRLVPAPLTVWRHFVAPGRLEDTLIRAGRLCIQARFVSSQ